uniref:Nucleotid_trans domain-containing protein n=1 Tax=Steinernema glaseri TaxID=37863 RepID=A0A1I7YQX3_9BILA
MEQKLGLFKFLKRHRPALYLRKLMPNWAYKFCIYSAYMFWFIVGLLVLRKTENATNAVVYVKTHGHTVGLDTIENSPKFKDLIETLDREFTKPPAFLLLNQYALNMTFNFLCNTQTFPGVHERLIFVTLDEKARDVLAEHWPNIRQLYWPTPSLYKPFSFAEGPYQTIYLLRANLAVSLLKYGKSFWMMQQDTFWRKNLFDLNFEENFEFDALFDQIGDDHNSQRAEWVNGESSLMAIRAAPLNRTKSHPRMLLAISDAPRWRNYYAQRVHNSDEVFANRSAGWLPETLFSERSGDRRGARVRDVPNGASVQTQQFFAKSRSCASAKFTGKRKAIKRRKGTNPTQFLNA